MTVQTLDNCLWYRRIKSKQSIKMILKAPSPTHIVQYPISISNN